MVGDGRIQLIFSHQYLPVDPITSETLAAV
ncbi:UNVERIFIED_ORG: hypothetical protein J2Y75_002308 [Pseudomonas silesiensis]